MHNSLGLRLRTEAVQNNLLINLTKRGQDKVNFRYFCPGQVQSGAGLIAQCVVLLLRVQSQLTIGQ
jgi:hypothetical protein